MRIGFDFDGTITKAPHVFKLLIESLFSQNHTLFLISGTHVNLKHELISELISYGIEPNMFSEIILKDISGDISDVTKWKYNNIDLLKIRLYFENRDETANKLSNLATILKII